MGICVMSLEGSIVSSHVCNKRYISNDILRVVFDFDGTVSTTNFAQLIFMTIVNRRYRTISTNCMYKMIGVKMYGLSMKHKLKSSGDKFKKRGKVKAAQSGHH